MTDEDSSRRPSPVSLRLHRRVRAWYRRRAAEEGLTPHGLMVRVLTDYADQATRRDAA